MWGVDETWVVSSLLLFSPRWWWAVPLLVLIPAAALTRPAASAPLGCASVIGLWLISGLVVSFPKSESPSDDAIRVVTCNTGGGQFQPQRLKQYLDEVRADIVLLQEWSDSDRDTVFGKAGGSEWHVVSSGGVTAASRQPIEALEGLPYGAFELPGAVGLFELATRSGKVRLVNVHLPTAREGIEAVIHWRVKGLPVLQANSKSRDLASGVARRFGIAGADSAIVAGDFNLPPESSILRRHWGDLKDAFATAGFGFGYTKYTHWHGVRIDHIRFDQTWNCVECRVGPDIGSDHRPVFAKLIPTVPQR
jgi:endonuclease/exonuclease/phosphatase (EEP) superfamily protein YafD